MAGLHSVLHLESVASCRLVVVTFIATIEYARVRTDGSVCALTVPDLTQFSIDSRYALFDRYQSRTFTFEQASGHEGIRGIHGPTTVRPSVRGRSTSARGAFAPLHTRRIQTPYCSRRIRCTVSQPNAGLALVWSLGGCVPEESRIMLKTFEEERIGIGSISGHKQTEASNTSPPRKGH